MKNLIWLASYPRSGNTWFRVFLSFLLSGNRNKNNLNTLELDFIANSRAMFDDLTGINSSDLNISEIGNLKPDVYKQVSDESSNRFYLKTHDQFYLNDGGFPVFPKDHTYGCVYIIRNPLDVAVSNALYFNRSLDDVIEAMNNPSYSLHPSIHNLYPVLEEKLGTWSSHVKTWLNSGLPLHLIRYEDMVSSPAETFSTALEFLDLHFPDELVLQAISETSFENLRKSEIQFGFKDKLQNCEAFFRNGKSGTWKESLSDQQVNRIVANHRDLMVEFGYLDGLETGNNKE